MTEQFSILDSVAGEAVPAESKTTVGSLTEVILPGNQGPRDVSAMGTARAIGGKDVTVALIGESLCAIQAMNAACGPISDVADGRLIGARPRSCGHYWIFGLAPDGVKEVQVDQSGDGGTESVIPVVGNVFEGVVKAAPTSVIGIDGRGDVQFETDLPLDYFDATNEACE